MIQAHPRTPSGVAETAAGAPPTGERRAWVEQIMGMPVSIHLRGDGARSETAASHVEVAFDELRAIDALFSTYRDDSLLSLVQRGELPLTGTHPLLDEVVGLCATAKDLTGGDFDAWRPVRTDASPEQTRPGDGDASGPRQFDPTGLVKGWAVQRAAERLVAGVGCDVMINAGGDIAVRPGSRSGSGAASDRTVRADRSPHEPWQVGIEDPHDPHQVLAVIPVTAGGVATSGSARRGQHIVDPRDGSPVPDAVLSVTVVGPSLIWADVLATAAFVRAGRQSIEASAAGAMKLGQHAVALVQDLAGYEALAVGTDGSVTTTTGLSSGHPHPSCPAPSSVGG